ncbi:hypothetical protein Tsubulata_033027 [Turnera subulata]|uniref:TRF2/HOY1 PH-like domain-containing protein n=1 Tax=Turnera subulata TaxID=218843 RepID=A0A9Q0JEQ5_9ROSI|nr:hypothetical protein Tsubulata_033027 [Turnera subulata]
MVQLMASVGKTTVKLEVDDSLEDQLTPLHKRSRLDSSLQGALCSPLEEQSPLGLRLKKSPSFLDMIQMKLSQENKSVVLSKKEHKVANSTSPHDKLKASNFPASLLKIGTWEYKSRYEGDLVAKCYFAKHKLVWEVLDGGLKNKIEIQWSDIVAIKANFSEDGPETLDVVLARQPLFFRETNPQPRKHTLWQATSDFTCGEASVHRRHFLQCQHGFLGKHFEKLIQCDPRLNYLSQQPEIVLESPYFEQRASAFRDLNDSSNELDLNTKEGPSVFSLNNECQGFMSRSPETISQDTATSNSAMESHGVEDIKSTRTAEHMSGLQIKLPGIHQSISMSDLVSHIGNCISEQISGNPVLSGENPRSSEILEEITQYLLSDSQLASSSDEQGLMSRVNSLCSLLQKDPATARTLQAMSRNDVGLDQDARIGIDYITASAETGPVPEGEVSNISGCKPPAMSRKDSVGELLLNLPRIASLPQFLYNF